MKMTYSKIYIYLVTVVIFCVLSCDHQQQSQEKTAKKPNIIYILADDLGYGDLSCYGQKLFKTPNIDKLATEGMLFTQHYSGATVCAPSRSALMTGLHTGHTPIRGNKEIMPEGQYPMPDSLMTLPKLLQANGYKTGGFGKWGLGFPGSQGDPNNQGFDYFYGYNCQRLAHHYYPRYLWRNQTVDSITANLGKEKGIYAPELIQDEVLSFVDANKDDPFFLYYAAVVPHAELIAPEYYMKKYRDKLEPEKDYEGYDEGPDYRQGKYESQAEPHAAFAAMITHLDDRVGALMAKLDELGIADNTLVIFTSDNGPHKEGGADPDYFDSNGIFKGYKRDLYEGGIRVPMIARWPGVIQPSSSSDHISAFWDILPTMTDVVGVELPKNIDGISFLPTLKGEQQPIHEYLYWEFHELGGRRAIRKDNWKLVQYNVGKEEKMSFELFDISKDPSETTNLYDKNPEIFEKLKILLLNARTNSEVFQFADDRYKG